MTVVILFDIVKNTMMNVWYDMNNCLGCDEVEVNIRMIIGSGFYSG